jgi:hypothetical protein
MGWHGPIATREGHGAVAKIWNESEHIDVQRTGYDPYVIYGWQAFWLGPPLRWPILNDKVKRSMAAKVARGQFPIHRTILTDRRVRMEPWGGSDFVARAADAVRPRMTSIFRRHGKRMAYDPLRRFFRG